MGAFNGDAGDSMRENQNQKLTTYDRGNDAWEEKNCAVEFMGSWWYTDCTYSNLFGLYLNETVDNMKWKCGIWYSWREEA
ncbi:GL26266 [Drosophila persimilis]|uniref:GL26266 n=1 Tax=Drosophila persimilis TaxID=7234 RepID=B4GJD4_DROPE|nr:GL26266 [Drosophila persimilis]